MKITETEKLSSILPDENTIYPRDNQIPARTNDYLFIAGMIANIKPPVNSLLIFKTPSQACYLTDAEGRLYHPVTGLEVKPPDSKSTNMIKRQTLNSYFRNTYFGLWNALCGRHWTADVCPECLGNITPFYLSRLS